MPHTMEKPEAHWREILDPEQFRIARLKGTEQPFTGEYWNDWRAGAYTCRCCGAPLFHSKSKFDAGCGWPSYSRAIEDDRIAEHRDTSHGMVRTEIVCKACGAHLGHVFPDGPAPTGMRHCVNAASLTFEPKQK